MAIVKPTAEMTRINNASMIILLSLFPRFIPKTGLEIHDRLRACLTSIVETDQINIPGRRVVQGGNMSLLQGFNFGSNDTLIESALTPRAVLIDRAAGTAIVHFHPFVPKSSCPDATHAELHTAVSIIDFKNGFYATYSGCSAKVPLHEATAVQQKVKIPRHSNLTIVVFAWVAFLKKTGAGYKLIKTDRVLPVKIIHVDALPYVPYKKNRA